jgi:hypothetical protein
MMLMAIANRRITGLPLGEVSFSLFGSVSGTKINQEVRGSMMKLQMNIICIYSLQSSRI